MRKRMLTFLMALTTAVPGCGQEGSDRTATPSGGRTSGLTQKQTPADSGGDGNFNPWLFSLEQAKAITPLVLPYQAASEDESTAADSSMKATQDFIGAIVDDMMKLNAHDPGRDFTVTVSADSAPNASALNQSLVIHKGLISFASNISLVMVLCHEIAHSTRNHSAKAEDRMAAYEVERKTQGEALDAKLDAFVKKAYNAATKEFTFTSQDYQDVKPAWNAFWSEFVLFQKKLESEADIVGGQICANAGFTPTEVEDGFNTLFEKFKSLDRSSTGPGTYEVEEKDLGDFIQAIFAETVHPEDAERQQQITRVKELFADTTDKAIATKWKSDFPAMGLTLAPNDHGLYANVFPHRTPTEDLMLKRIQRVLTGN